MLEVLALLRQDCALRRADEERKQENRERRSAADHEREVEALARREAHGEERADGRSDRDAEGEVADTRAHALQRDEGRDDRAGRRGGRTERHAVDEAHDEERGEPWCQLVPRYHQREDRGADEEGATAADEINEAAGRDAGAERADDEDTGGEARHADGGIPHPDGIGRGPQHQQEMHAVDEKIHADIEEIIPRPERLRVLCSRCGRLRVDILRHDGRLLSSAGDGIELAAQCRRVIGGYASLNTKLG